jgi:hypothetical protein
MMVFQRVELALMLEDNKKDPEVRYLLMEKCALPATRWCVPARGFRPGEFAHVADGAEVLRGHAHDISVEQLIPRIAGRHKTAAETVPTKMYLYQAIRGGRRCSCFDIETEASNLCPACFGTGIVGGYNKYGTLLEVVDVTRPNVKTTNIIPDYSMRTRPTRLKLIDGAIHGSMEVRIDLGSNIGLLDALKASYHTVEGNSLTALIRSPADREFVTLNRENLQPRLGNPWLELKVNFDRVSMSNAPPFLDVIYLRYRTLQNNLLSVDIPRVEKSVALQEIGIADEWSTQNFWLDNTIRTLTTEDFFVSESGNTRWKILMVKDFAPNGYLVRLVQQHEPYAKVPHTLPPGSKPGADWNTSCSSSGTCR